MSRKVSVFVGFALIILLLSVELQAAVQPALSSSSLSSIIPPRTGSNLRELVEALMNATDPEDRIDTDSDGLYDSVELVIGTDFNNTDSDFDRLDDYWEAMNDLDPLEPDSNSDGLPDYFETQNVTSLDVDGDGVLNAWDFDNDDDGVNDGVDLSPFSLSIASSRFHVDIETDGKPLYVTFQLKPQNPEHLKLFYQMWDWPYDSEGSMRDLDNSLEDLKIVPQLNLTMNVPPSQADVKDYGILVTSSGMQVPLNPIWEYGDIVAFTGKLFYPASTTMTLSLDAELIWRVIGQTDVKARALNATGGKYVSIVSEDSVVANASEIAGSETFQWIEKAENKVVIKSINGRYLSVTDAGKIVANETQISEHESFLLEDLGNNTIALRAYTGRYISASASGALYANGTSLTGSEKFMLIDRGYLPDSTVLVTYDEDFMLTGLKVEESYSSDLSVFYSADLNQTVAADLLMTYMFLRNSTTMLSEMPSMLSDYDIDIANLGDSFSHKDEALVAMGNVLIPKALVSLPENEHLPVIIAFADRFKSIDMSETMPGSSLMGDSIAVDLAEEAALTVKTMKTNWYNTSSFTAVDLKNVVTDIQSWGFNDKVTLNLMTMMMRWNIGEQVVTQVGSSPITFDSPEGDVIDGVQQCVSSGLSSLELGYRGLIGLKAFFDLSLLWSKGWSVSIQGSTSGFRVWLKTATDLADAKAGFFGKLGTSMKVIAVLAIIIDVGFSILQGIFLAQSIGGRLGKEIGAMYGLFSALYAVIMGVILYGIGQIPYVGWLIALAIALADIFGGFGQKLVQWLVSLFYGTPTDLCVVEPSVEVVGEPEINTYDWDNNGLDAGDRIEVLTRLLGNVTGTKGVWPYQRDYTYASWYLPYISIEAPWGSFSETYTTGVPTTSTWNNSYGLYWKAQEYDTGAWIEPGIGMDNFPVKINLNSNYGLYHAWEHFEFYVFYWEDCHHYDLNQGTYSSHFTTVYFDVLPGNISDFASWRHVTPLDHDGDGLKDSEETKSDPWRYDTDGDGLNDKYEIQIGTDPRNYDTDSDGLIDNFELVYGTNATKSDTDGDRLPDYLEMAGWVIPFNYTGDPNKPFTMRVYSDPRVADTDGDGVDDYVEYWSDLNPRSKDTDGDGIQDVADPKYPQTTLTFVRALNMTGPASDLVDLDVDADGNLYVLRYPDFNETTRQWTNGIFKYAPNGTLIASWPTYIDVGLSSIAVDGNNGYFYVASSYWGWPIRQHSLNGTLIKELPSISRVRSMDVDEDGYLYATVQGDTQYSVLMFASNGTMVGTWENRGDAPDKLNTVAGIAIDDKNDYIYIIDIRYTSPSRVTKWTKNGQYITSLPDGFGYPRGLDVDEYGYVYVTDSWKDNLRKFDSNGMPIATWGNTGHEDGNFTRPIQVVVDLDDNVYVADSPVGEGDYDNPYPLGRIQKFSQRAEEKPPFDDSLPDRDGDGLENAVESDGWNVTFTNVTSTYTIHVSSDPMLNDTDADGLTDYQEHTLGTNPRDPDSDDDGLTDFEEAISLSPQTNPNHWDTDSDGLGDGTEIAFGSDPTKSDTDGDGLSDPEELILGSDPRDIDTDHDGLDDLQEKMFNSSITEPDADGDFMFDGAEKAKGTNPKGKDTDNDGLTDGEELLFAADPLQSDSDGDHLTDGTEVELWLNPASNDTDGDGLLDLTELEKGTSPWNPDSDGDGIPDGSDPDSNSPHVKHIVLAYDSDPDNTQFAQDLAKYTNVTVASVDDLLLNYVNATHVVLVGRPDGNGTVGKLVHDLLVDCGDLLDQMIESDDSRLVVRHGIWSSTQTVVLLSHPYPEDYSRILDILRGKIVTILPNSAKVEYLRSLLREYPQGGSLNHTATSYHFFSIGEIDTVKQTDAMVSVVLEKAVVPTVELLRFNNSTTPFELTYSSGLDSNEKAVGKYLQVNVSSNVQNQTSDIVQAALVQIYYTELELDRTGDGDANDLDDIHEETLILYFFNESAGRWTKLTKDLDWVIDTGVNTTDVELYGKAYAGYVWAYVSHFSLYGLAGISGNRPPDVTNARPSIEYLWPPNHKFVNVTIEGVTDPDGDEITITILSITSDEPTAPHEPDAYGVRTDTASLRAERLGNGNGRVYQLTFVASDGKGGETIGTVRVYVTHDQKDYTCIDDGQKYDATATD